MRSATIAFALAVFVAACRPENLQGQAPRPQETKVLDPVSVAARAPVNLQAEASRPRETKVQLILKDSFSTAGVSAVIRRTPDNGSPAMIAFRSRHFSPELLGYTLMSLNANVNSDSQPLRRPRDTRVSSSMPLPRLEGAWGETVRTLADQLQRASEGNVVGVGKAKAVTVSLPAPPPCPECERRSGRANP